jgi:hypothetical protein
LFLNPLGEFACTDAPLVADPESRNFFELYHL